MPSVRIDALMPTSSPLRLASAPPELPGLMGASVWIMALTPPLAFGTGRLTDETMPAVTVCCSWKGLPMATVS